MPFYDFFWGTEYIYLGHTNSIVNTKRKMKTHNNSIWYVCLSPTREAQQKHIFSVGQGKLCPSKGAIHDSEHSANII